MIASAELERALAAIAARHPNADVVRHGIEDAYAEDEPTRRVVYLEPKRTRLEAGDPYVTWVVTFVEGAVVEVDEFVSRACRPR
ncbi:MAG: hypothetical protein KC586_01660 [Myxococcales bacterium]|nr:hypothetical protein [Myxococcales bacterium]